MRQKPVRPFNKVRSLEVTNLEQAEHDLVIIGGGVAGYVAAIKAGQEGMKVANKISPDGLNARDD